MKKLLSFICLIAISILPVAAHAQFNLQTNIGSSFGISDTTKSLEDTTIGVVNWVLALLGLIAVIMIIASVIIGATSGDSNRGATARKALISAIIGLVIILLAWVIINFVVNTTTEIAT